MDARSIGLVQEQLRRTSRSLLQYLGESAPWTGANDEETMDRLRQLILEEQAAGADLARLLRQQRAPGLFLGSYPESFTTLNFVSLDRLLPLLVAYQRQAITKLEGSLPQVQDAEALVHLQKLLEMRRRHLAILEELNKIHPHVGVRV
jgi:hypothetical protein